MKHPLPLRLADVRGTLRLAADATLATTGLVEAMHARIARLPGTAAPERTRGIARLVYGSVRGVTRLVGGSADLLLRGLDAALPLDAASSRQREALVAALNGVLGDHLAASGNPLATTMALHTHLTDEAAAAAPTEAGDQEERWLVLVHGLCMNDWQWDRNGHDHGQCLQRDLGLRPFYLRYNTGLHISQNGRQLADQLEALVRAAAQPPKQLVLLCHSMGGLVARSAVHQARLDGHAWTGLLSDIVFLGTPHHGAPLERAGHGLERLLAALPYASPIARLGRIRSAGITDLRHGSLLACDWQDPARAAGRLPHPVPLPEGVRCFAVAASLGRREGDAKDRVLGDGLVPLASALGSHARATRALAFPSSQRMVRYGLDHLGLLSDAKVYARLRSWLATSRR